MRVEEIGSIKYIELPDSFARGEVQMGGMGQNWRRIFQPRDKKDADDASIVAFYRGAPASAEDAAPFRHLLKQPPSLLFSTISMGNGAQQHNFELIRELESILGQCGNNQIANIETGVQGPRFCLEKLETILVSGKNVLALSGFFHDMDLHPQAFLRGLFFDAQPESTDCIVEELIFEAQTRILYDKYSPAFEKSLSTICWR